MYDEVTIKTTAKPKKLCSEIKKVSLVENQKKKEKALTIFCAILKDF